MWELPGRDVDLLLASFATFLFFALLGTLFILNGDFTAARETLTETYRNVQSSYGRDHEFTAMTAMTLADAQIKSGRYLEAQLLLKDALRIAKRWEPTPGELTVSVYNYFSEEALARKDIPAAREYISLKAKAVELASDELQKRNDYLSFLQAQLAASEKRWPEVLVLARQAKRQYVLPDGNYIFDVDLFVLFQKTAQAHIALGQWFEASAELDALDHLMAGKLPKLHPLNNEQQRLRAQLAKRIT